MSLPEHDERDGEREAQQAYISTREGATKMHHPDCEHVSDKWSSAPAPLLALKGFTWADCCSQHRDG